MHRKKSLWVVVVVMFFFLLLLLLFASLIFLFFSSSKEYNYNWLQGCRIIWLYSYMFHMNSSILYYSHHHAAAWLWRLFVATADRGKLIYRLELFFQIFRQQIATVEIDEFQFVTFRKIIPNCCRQFVWLVANAKGIDTQTSKATGSLEYNCKWFVLCLVHHAVSAQERLASVL